MKARILQNKSTKNSYFHLVLEAPRIAKAAHPGEFVNIKVGDFPSPLLRRPLGVHRIRGAKLEILYEVVGEGTRALSKRDPGEYLDIIGPLGNGFDYKSQSHKVTPLRGQAKSQVLVAGGMGVAPLIFLAEKLAKLQTPNSKLQNLVLIGAKTKSQIICEEEFRKLGCEVKIATDDGSKGFKGKVTELLKNLLLTAYNLQLTTIYACGPRPMLKEIASLSKEYNVPAQISLEEHMSCGIGACLGCVVNTKAGYKRVCKEGPVFNAEEIIW